MMCLTLLSLLPSTGAYFFYSLGDWGGDSDSKPTTAVELNNAMGMVAAASTLGTDSEPVPRFGMLVGDNFYSAGISGDELSSRFQSTFEDAFPASHNELSIPFYAVAGNHDHKGNVTAQISYAHHSARWKFDDFWYTFSATDDSTGMTTQVVYIDTVTLAGSHYHDDVTGRFVHDEPHPMEVHAPSQLEWLETTLATSTADYLWVSGHYPIYSQCSHGPTTKLHSSVLPLLKKHNVTGYIAGHDHCSGYYFDAGIAHVVAGAGKECCYSPSNLNNKNNPGQPLFRMDADKNKGDGGGFASYSVTDSSTTIRFHAASGKVQYTAAPIPPRKLTMVEEA